MPPPHFDNHVHHKFHDYYFDGFGQGGGGGGCGCDDDDFHDKADVVGFDDN